FLRLKSSSLFIVVLFDPAKSALPPKKFGTDSAIALSTSPDEALVAKLSFPGSSTGKSFSQSTATSPLIANADSSANSGHAACYDSINCVHCLSPSSPLLPTFLLQS